jgi:3-isopropylmalate/(R)-2-methylmalate dehydratase small subunit
MEPVRQVIGRAVPLERADVDTDQIIPAAWLKRIERTGFGEGLFSAWRADPDFVLNRPEYEGARVLLAGPNFGSGSSREHAAWALQDYGFAAVISPRFADIFRSNALKIGLLPVELPAETVERLMAAVAADPSAELTVDLETRTVAAPAAGVEATFELDDFTRWRLLSGLDDIGLTLRHEVAISAYEAGRREWLPKVATAPAGLAVEER